MTTNKGACPEIELAGLNYRSRSDMAKLALAVSELPTCDDIVAATFIVDQDLLRPQWWMRLLAWIARLRHGSSIVVWGALEQQSPGQCRALIDATARWIATGKDRYTKDAAGGFSPQEVKAMARFLKARAHAQGTQP